MKETVSKKKINITLLVFLIVIILFLFSALFYFVKFPEKESTLSTNPFGEFGLEYDQTPLLACFIGIEGYKNFCLKPENKGFYPMDLLDEHPEIQVYPSGLYILELKEDSLRSSKVNADIILEKWYKYILLNEGSFIREVGEKKTIDLYNLTQLRMIQMKKGVYSESDMIEEFTNYSEGEYIPTSPMRYSDFSFLCSIAPKMCVSFSNLYKIPFLHLREINQNPDSDITDLELVWSNLKMLNLGINSLNNNSLQSEETSIEYEKFLSNVLKNNQGLTKEEALFIGEYLPIWLLDYVDVLYKSWVGESKDYYIVLLDSVCKESQCLEIKLNVLYNEFKN